VGLNGLILGLQGVSEISAGAMAVTMKLMASMVALFGVVSFIIGVIAENKKVNLYIYIYIYIYE
jgi:hypothetical protein